MLTPTPTTNAPWTARRAGSIRRGFLALAGSVLAAVAVGPLTGCGSDSSMLTPERRSAAVPVDADAYAALGYRLQWRGFARMTRGADVRFFGVMDDIIGVQESSSVISLLDARSGVTRWSDELANPLTKFVGLTRDESRLISSSETEAYFLSIDTGTLVEKHRLDRVVNTRPLMAGGVMIYGTSTGEVIGVLRERGFRLWGNSVTGAIDADPVYVGEYAAVVSQAGEILFFDPVSGSGVARNRIAAGVAPTSELASSDTTLFVASLDQSLYAFDARSGRQLWRKRTDTPIRTAPVYFSGVVYLDTPGQGMTAYNASTGRILWASQGVHGRIVAMRNGRLIAWDAPSEAAVTLDPATGDVVDRVRLRGVRFMQPDRFEDGNLYIASPNGVVSKFVPRT